MSLFPSQFFKVTVVGDVTVIRLLAAVDDHDRSPEVDVAALLHRLGGPAPQPPAVLWERFQSDLLALLDANQPTKIVLDFAGLSQIGGQAVLSSAMNSVYASAKQAADSLGCHWRVCGLNADARSIFDVSALYTLFPQVHDTQAAALAAFSARSS